MSIRKLKTVSSQTYMPVKSFERSQLIFKSWVVYCSKLFYIKNVCVCARALHYECNNNTCKY